MNALGMARLMAHWESERQRFMRQAHEASAAGRPALPHLRTASRCEARVNKLVRLTNRAAQPRSAA
jgi:hypothetical protein